MPRHARRPTATAHRESWIPELIGAIALAWTLLFFNLFAQITAVEHYGGELFNQLFAPASPGWSYLFYGYGKGAQDKILVILLTDHDLAKMKSKAWPVLYSDHAAVIGAILARHPRALMIDFVFVDAQRPDLTIRSLQDELSRHRPEEIPVFLASPSTDTSPSGDILLPLRETFATPVPVPALGAGIEYPLLTFTRDNMRQPTAAAAIYGALCNEPGVARRDNKTFCQPSTAGAQVLDMKSTRWTTLELFWGTNHPEHSDYGSCREIPGFLGRLWDIIWSQGEGFRVACPFTRTLTVTSLMSRSESDLLGLIEGQVVLYGSNLVAGSDIVFPPTHFSLPGVYAHAMALDNLLTFGTKYKRDVTSTHVPIISGLASRLDEFLGRHPGPLSPALLSRPQNFLRCFTDGLTPHCVQYALLVLIVIYLALVTHLRTWLCYPFAFRATRRWSLNVLLLLCHVMWYLAWYIVFYFVLSFLLVIVFTTRVQFQWLSLTAGNWLEALLEAWAGYHWGPRMGEFVWRHVRPPTGS